MLSTVARLIYAPALQLQPGSARTPTPNDFHFCRVQHGDRFAVALERHVHHLCGALHLESGQRVLHVGSGTGDVAVELARFADVAVVGVEACPAKVRVRARRGQRGMPV